MSRVDNKIGGLEIEIGGLKQTQQQLEARLQALEFKVDTLITQLDERVTKLEATNQIWKSNFRVVNKTFAELRRKFKIGIPMLMFQQ